MPLDAPIKISQQAKNLQAVLQQYAAQRGGMAVVASNLKELWEQASISNDQPRILICYDGEVARGDFASRSALNRVDRSWKVAVIRGRGFSSERGDSLIYGVVNAPPFYDVVEDVRDQIRSILNISEEFPVEFMAIRPLSQGTMILDAYTIEFTTANDIPAILIDEPDYPMYPDPNPEPGDDGQSPHSYPPPFVGGGGGLT